MFVGLVFWAKLTLQMVWFGLVWFGFHHVFKRFKPTLKAPSRSSQLLLQGFSGGSEDFGGHQIAEGGA